MNTRFDYPATVVDADPAVVFCLDSALTITYCNAAWERFALQNEAPELCGPAPIGKCVLDYISGPARNFYASVYERVLVTSKPWEHRYECSSAEVYREFRLLVIPIHKYGSLFVRSSLEVEHAHQRTSCGLSETAYRQSNGLIIMCSSCRRTRRSVSGTNIWDWVPAFLALPPADKRDITYGICPACHDIYYRDV